MSKMYSPLPTFLLLLLPLLQACLLNKTHCTCSNSEGGSPCLRRQTDKTCTIYPCRPGPVCDCMGNTLCSISNCPSTRTVFRPTAGHIPTSGIVLCEPVHNPVCVNFLDVSAAPLPISPPIARPSVSPMLSTSYSAIPSVSVSISPTPSISLSAMPSTALSATPSISLPVTPSIYLSSTPSASLSATPSVSLSATPSISLSTSPTTSLSPTATSSIATTPTASSSPTPSKASSPTPLPSMTKTPSPAPSPSRSSGLPLQIGAHCSAQSPPCVEGSTCSCAGTCEEEVFLEIAALGDDFVRLYTCDQEIGFSGGRSDIAHFSFSGACKDLFGEVSNANGHYSGLAMSIDHEGHLWSTGLGLSAVVQENPPPGYLTYPQYDFSSWKTPVVNRGIQLDDATDAYALMQDEYGALPISMFDGPSPPSTFVYKIPLPFCTQSKSWQF